MFISILWGNIWVAMNRMSREENLHGALTITIEEHIPEEHENVKRFLDENYIEQVSIPYQCVRLLYWEQ